MNSHQIDFLLDAQACWLGYHMHEHGDGDTIMDANHFCEVMADAMQDAVKITPEQIWTCAQQAIDCAASGQGIARWLSEGTDNMDTPQEWLMTAHKFYALHLGQITLSQMSMENALEYLKAYTIRHLYQDLWAFQKMCDSGIPEDQFEAVQTRMILVMQKLTEIMPDSCRYSEIADAPEMIH